jgi:hypothetical protein
MLFSEIIHVNSENYREHINVATIQSLRREAGGKYCALWG